MEIMKSVGVNVDVSVRADVDGNGDGNGQGDVEAFHTFPHQPRASRGDLPKHATTLQQHTAASRNVQPATLWCPQ
eukprot:10487676-Lingulodinium_polyedra.AAC.1